MDTYVSLGKQYPIFYTYTERVCSVHTFMNPSHPLPKRRTMTLTTDWRDTLLTLMERGGIPMDSEQPRAQPVGAAHLWANTPAHELGYTACS